MRLGLRLACQRRSKPTPPARAGSWLGHDCTFLRRACSRSRLQNSARLPGADSPPNTSRGFASLPELRGARAAPPRAGSSGQLPRSRRSGRFSPGMSDSIRPAGIPVLRGLIGNGSFLEGLVCGLTLPAVPVSLQLVVAHLCGSCLKSFCLCLSLTSSRQNIPSRARLRRLKSCSGWVLPLRRLPDSVPSLSPGRRSWRRRWRCCGRRSTTWTTC